MKDTNTVSLVGRLTRDAELTYTGGGFPVLKFAIAVNRSKKEGDGWVDEASFFDVTVWGKMGESINKFLVKGKQVAVSGELRQERWEKDGDKRSKVIISAEHVQLLGDSSSTHQVNSSSNHQTTKKVFQDDIPATWEKEGEIPF